MGREPKILKQCTTGSRLHPVIWLTGVRRRAAFPHEWHGGRLLLRWRAPAMSL